jgi:hypothetical protein
MLNLPLVRSVPPSPVALFRSADTPHPERAMARGTLVRVHRGVYAPATQWNALAPWERYLARVHAVGMTHPAAVFCYESAAALLGMPLFGDPVTVHVLTTSAAASRLTSGVRTHVTADDRALVEAGGLAMTTLAETAVDLARQRHPAIGLAAADAALRLDPDLTGLMLSGVNEARTSSRGRRVARWPLSRANRLAETALESVSRAVVEWLGFPAPAIQVAFPTRAGTDRTDFFWREFSVAGESDGDLKYDGRFGDPRAVLRKQRDRDARLREHVRTVTHWGWHETTAVTPLRSILLGAGVPQIVPENSARLHSVKRLVARNAPHRTGDAR